MNSKEAGPYPYSKYSESRRGDIDFLVAWHWTYAIFILLMDKWKKARKNTETVPEVCVTELFGLASSIVSFGSVVNRRIYRALGDYCTPKEFDDYYNASGDTRSIFRPETFLKYLNAMISAHDGKGFIEVGGTKVNIFPENVVQVFMAGIKWYMDYEYKFSGDCSFINEDAIIEYMIHVRKYVKQHEFTASVDSELLEYAKRTVLGAKEKMIADANAKIQIINDELSAKLAKFSFDDV